MKVDETNRIADDFETLPADDAVVSRMLGALPRVEAPRDFDFHVRARIANGRPAAAPFAAWFPGYKLLAPLAAVILVALIGLGVFRYTSETETQVADIQSPPPAAAQAQTEQPPTFASTTGSQPAGSPEENLRSGRQELVVARATPKQKPKVPGSQANPGWSEEKMVNPGKSIFPKGMDPEPSRPDLKTAGIVATAKTSVHDVLMLLGIEAEQAQGGWRVKAAAANGAAERSGVKVGDVIEAIEDQQLGTSSVFTGSVSFKSMKVLRDGKSLVIALENR